MLNEASNADLKQQCHALKRQSKTLNNVNSQTKNALLKSLAQILHNATDEILSANRLDLEQARDKQLSTAMIDRLMLNPDRIQAMANALEELCLLPDPIGEIKQSILRPNGIRVAKMSIPLGVILMIYESRPNVTVEAAALCVKSGNAVIMRGGSEAFHSNQVLAKCWQKALDEHSLPRSLVTVVETTDRTVMYELLQLNDCIDLVIPRGGEGLIHFVVENSKIPVIQHYKGVCHLYIDEFADMQMALKILLDGKTSRPGVCNALETLLIHNKVAEDFLKLAQPELEKSKVEVRGCEQTCKIYSDLGSSAFEATTEDYAAEFLDLILAVKIVDEQPEAIEHIQQYSSDHTEVIVTDSVTRSENFIKEITSSVVMVNASSRFSDGGELGLGAEIGISTSKLHAYGPMGLKSLTTEKFVVAGQGQIRHNPCS